jgi:glycerol-3-phosphate acyltransferase PlsY
LVIAYLLGSVPTGYLAGKLLRGIDIREHGSKSTGATNVLRALGKWPALAVLVGDVLKGVGAIVVARWFCRWLYAELSPMPTRAPDLQIWVPWAVCLAGIAVLVGHSRSIWLNLTGGKSAATGGSASCWRCRGPWGWVLRRYLVSFWLSPGSFPLARCSRR